MERAIVRDTNKLTQKARKAKPDDRTIAVDLRDTLRANADRGVGLAANMIGESIAIIVVHLDSGDEVMINPRVTKKKAPYLTEEGCLSLDGTRPVQRFKSLHVGYQSLEGQHVERDLSGFEAQIVQHEMDHLAGILI